MYNAQESIQKSLNSIKDQIWNGDFEVIIVNDGSTDGSAKIVEEYIHQNAEGKFVFINQKNGGVSKARNAGMKVAKGDYIAFLDADDIWMPEKTMKQMYFLENDSIDFITSLWNNVRVSFPYVVNPSNGLVEVSLKKLLLKVTGQTSTAIFKREVLEKIGLFDEMQRYAEDANFWMRVTEHYKMYLLPEPLVIAGEGKKSFGHSGLSANLKEMEKGIQKNIAEMYRSKRINGVQFLFYFVISKLKYWVRPIRAKL